MRTLQLEGCLALSQADIHLELHFADETLRVSLARWRDAFALAWRHRRHVSQSRHYWRHSGVQRVELVIAQRPRLELSPHPLPGALHLGPLWLRPTRKQTDPES
ncbi:hypothetical protein [Ferrimonas marina]|uniref:Uncharacterized protein n=1 Tax=Ferrimonas marina TaxID=299255 RepID=A0A1M5ZBJ8_9GAMM|nr:hypothetical protein [Ferrimonas marina]SHI21562.1 hypothetical protein SAMN02745129_0154 [Ferrimonas marina]